MLLDFFKMHGTGNDYIYIDFMESPVTIGDIETTCIKLCNRHFGIGADGIVLILPSNIADCRMRMFNSDGSEGKMCGNAIRCIAKYIYEKKYVTETNIKIQTQSGIKNISIDQDQGKFLSCTVDMGKPIFDSKLIPAISSKKSIINEKIIINNTMYRFTCLSIGNPHCVVFVEDLENIDINKVGPLFENNIRFPNKINTEFVKVLSKNEINVRVWERGSGETLSCGTGACASVVASILNNYCDYDSDINVHLIGGILTVKWEKDGYIYLKGPAEFVYDGKIDIKK